MHSDAENVVGEGKWPTNALEMNWRSIRPITQRPPVKYVRESEDDGGEPVPDESRVGAAK